MPRLFTALEIPYQATQSLSLLRGGLPGARWIDAENYHITLRFFGDVENHIADEIVYALSRIKRQPFTISLTGVSVFGSKKPHSLYAGVTATPELLSLQHKIETTVQRLGLPAEKRKFTPHVTIARLRNCNMADILNYLSTRGNFSTIPFEITRFVLMSSHHSIGGGPYIIEDAWPLNM